MLQSEYSSIRLYFHLICHYQCQTHPFVAKFIKTGTKAEMVHQFTKDNSKDITAMIYSSYDTFTCVLDDPIFHGFTFEDIRKENGGIWYDHLHPTSVMHNIIANDIAQFLSDQPAFTDE
jgi:hypothetical protein